MDRKRWRRGPVGVARGGWGASIALGVALGLLCAWRLGVRMTPGLADLARARMSNEVTAAVTAGMERAMAREFGAPVALTQAGEITALTADTARLNRVRGRVLEEVLARLEQQRDIPVPVGSLTGWRVLAGYGPCIRARVLAPAAGTAELKSSLSSAGENRTRYRMDLEVTVWVKFLLPGGVREETLTAAVPVAETVLVGPVPQQMEEMGEP